MSRRAGATFEELEADDDALIEAIPEMRADNLPEYLAAVNRAVLHNALTAQTARTMLYGAQLLLAATPPAAQPPRYLSGGPRTIEA